MMIPERYSSNLAQLGRSVSRSYNHSLPMSVKFGESGAKSAQYGQRTLREVGQFRGVPAGHGVSSAEIREPMLASAMLGRARPKFHP